MPWQALTPDDVLTQLSADEAEKLREYSLADGQSDPLPAIIQQVTDECRGYIGAHTGNALGPSGTIAPQVLSAAISIVRWRLTGRLGIGTAAALLQTPQRQKDYEDAVQFLQAVAAGKIMVEQPPAEDVGPEVAEGQEGKWGSNDPVNFNV